MSRRSAAILAAAALCALTVAGCASKSEAAPDWRAQPSSTLEPGNGPGVNPGPAEPFSGPSGSSSSSGTKSPDASPSSSGGADSNVVATNLAAPVGLAVMPDTSAIVGERTTGRIVRVQPTPGHPVTVVRTLPGLDASGDGGLLDLALSPKFTQDGLVYAYVTTPTDNRVIVFTLTGPVTNVITGIPHGKTGNEGRVAFDQGGNLLIGTGDAGQPALAANPTSLAGKVLRVTPAGAPVGSSAVMTSGHQDSAGLCVDPRTGAEFQIERSTAAGGDEVNVLQAGASYGYPTPGAGVPPAGAPGASQKGLGGCAVVDNALFVTSLDGQELLSATFTAAGRVKLDPFTESLKGTYGRLTTVVAAPDGTLWLTTSNRDGFGTPSTQDERVLHIQQPSGTGSDSKL